MTPRTRCDDSHPYGASPRTPCFKNIKDNVSATVDI